MAKKKKKARRISKRRKEKYKVIGATGTLLGKTYTKKQAQSLRSRYSPYYRKKYVKIKKI